MLEPAGPEKGVAADSREAEEIITGSKNPLNVHADSSYDLPHRVDGVNDLEDSDDEVDNSESSRSVVNRRRMVLDVDDDD